MCCPGWKIYFLIWGTYLTQKPFRAICLHQSKHSHLECIYANSLWYRVTEDQINLCVSVRVCMHAGVRNYLTCAFAKGLSCMDSPSTHPSLSGPHSHTIYTQICTTLSSKLSSSFSDQGIPSLKHLTFSLPMRFHPLMPLGLQIQTSPQSQLVHFMSQFLEKNHVLIAWTGLNMGLWDPTDHISPEMRKLC